MPNGNGKGWIGYTTISAILAIATFIIYNVCAKDSDLIALELRASQTYATTETLTTTKSDITQSVAEVKADIKDLRKETLSAIERLGEKIDNLKD